MNRKITTLLIAIGVNILLIATKFYLANVSGSLALSASGWHSFADVFVSIVVLIGIVLAERTPSQPSPVINGGGQGGGRISRIEHAVSLFVSIFVFYMGYRVFADVIGGHEHELMNVGWVAVGAVLTIAFAYFMGRYKTFVGRAVDSPALVADGTHSMMDVYSSTVVLAGLLGYLVGFRSLDKVAAVIVALFIFSAGYHIFQDAVAGLSESSHLEHRFPLPTRFSRRAIALIAILLIAGWGLSGFYFVQPDEQAVVRRFGQRVAVGIGPGLGYRLPWPIETVTKAKVSRVQQVEPISVELLTGDENLVQLDFTVHYTIADIAAYLFNISDPRVLIRADAEAAIRQTVGERAIDDLLTTGRAQAEARVQNLLQAYLDTHQSGLHVATVRLVKVRPPEPVAAAFLDVASAREDKATYINEATAYANEIVPKARGEAEKTVKAAEAYRTTKINNATGDAARFATRHTSHAGAAKITEVRLYLESVERALGKVRKYLISPDLKGSSLDFWFLGQGATLPPFNPTAPTAPSGSSKP
jgi:membrane protease subunit HflK